MRKQRHTSASQYCEADQRLCFRYMDSTISLLLKSQIQASSLLLTLYRPVFVGPGWKPQRPVFSHQGSYDADKFQCRKKDKQANLDKHLTFNILKKLTKTIYKSLNKTAIDIPCQNI